MFYANAARYAVESNKALRSAQKLALQVAMELREDPREAEYYDMKVEEEWHYRHQARWMLINAEDVLDDQSLASWEEEGREQVYPNHRPPIEFDDISF